MKEKINLLRQKLEKELSEVSDGIHIKLDYDTNILNLLLFDFQSTTTNKQYKRFVLPKYILNKIDFSNVSFDLFDCENYDFSNLYGIELNPQTIYDKNLTNTKLANVKFIGSFDDATITGADFTGSINAIINPIKLKAEKQIRKQHWGLSSEYSKTVDLKACVFKDVTFTNSFQRIRLDSHYSACDLAFDIMDANFTDSKNATIYTDSLWITGFQNAILKGVTIIGELSYEIDYSTETGYCFLTAKRKTPVTGANFKGSKTRLKEKSFKFKYTDQDKMLCLNPQEVEDRNLSNAKFEGIYFTGSFDKVNISNSDFTGSKNAVIDLRQLTPELYKNTNFSNTKVIGLDGKEMYISSDGRIGVDIELAINKLLKLDAKEAIISKKELEAAREKLIEDNRKRVKEKITELLKIVESSEKLGIEPKNLYCSIPIEQDLFLVPVDNHYEINRNIIDATLLRFLNLSLIDFTNVDVSSIDFRYSGARISPQKVYQKDLSYTTLDDNNIKFYDDFTDVNLEGANFDACSFKPKELEQFKIKTKRSLFSKK